MDNPNEELVQLTFGGAFSEGASDFWAVWCPQERHFVEDDIRLNQFQAQQVADRHNEPTQHRAQPYHVQFTQPA
ncbi:hypothetical protein ACWC10_30300 [Streptomyces sp. NPDC001595]|uniref:hypothetical protein n=1 Tax=Streptomyces sp. NPDC001532 TaxID=3154520 RepID=UPI00331FF029